MTDVPPRRRIVLHLTNRQQNDPQALLEAIRSALRQKGITLTIKKSEESGWELTIPTGGDIPRDDSLGESINRMATSVLDGAAANAQEKTSKALVKVERNKTEILALRKGIGAYMLYQLSRGVRITVDLLEHAVGAAGTTVKRVIGGLFGGGEGGHSEG